MVGFCTYCGERVGRLNTICNRCQNAAAKFRASGRWEQCTDCGKTDVEVIANYRGEFLCILCRAKRGYRARPPGTWVYCAGCSREVPLDEFLSEHVATFRCSAAVA